MVIRNITLWLAPALLAFALLVSADSDALAASIIIPLALTKGLQMKAGRELRKSTQ